MSAAEGPALRFKRLQQLFSELIELAPAQRARRLEALQDQDAALCAELQRLLLRDAEAVDAATAPPLGLLHEALEACEPAPPARIGRFQIVGELGRGGMGRVLHGICRAHGVEQHAAIKVLRGDVQDPLAQARLREEARALASLEHPGIARLLEAGRGEDGSAFVAMERVRGQPLMAWCAQRRLDLRARVEVFRGVLAAVAHAHRALVVHRDIKPSNVMVDEDGRPRLLDFGLARFIEAEPETRTQTGARFLTPAYAAPEQIRGERITIACDLYALGALLYELLAGVPPFELSGLTAGEAERLLLQVPPPPLEHSFRQRAGAAARIGTGDPRAWARALRDDLEAVVQKALRKTPEQRYLSVEAFDADLQRWLTRRPVGARRGRFGYRARLFLRRHAAASAGAGLLLLGLGVAAHQVWQQGRIAAHERDRALAALSLLNDAFVAADPSQSSAGETSVRAVLAAAAGRVQELRDSQPQLHAELAAQISEIRSRLGIIVDDGLLAAALAGPAAGAQADPALRLRLQLAAVREDVLAQRLQPAQQRIAALRAAHPDEPRLLQQAALSALLDRDGDAALRELESALALVDPQRDALLVRELRVDRARALQQLGRAGEALTELDQVLLGLRAEDAAAQAALRLYRFDVLIELGRFDEADATLGPLRDALAAHFGERSSLLAHLHASHASMRARQERNSEAAAEYRRAAELYAQALGDHHLNAARARFNAAQLRAFIDPHDLEADADYRAAIESASRARAPESALPTYFRVKFARTLQQRGDLDAARRTVLPDSGLPRVTELSAGNRSSLRQLLGELFGTPLCAPRQEPPAAAAPAPERAHFLFCAPVPAGLAESGVSPDAA